MREYDPHDYHFRRQATRMHRMDRLEFEDAVPPLRPYVRLRWVVTAVILLALIAIHWS